MYAASSNGKRLLSINLDADLVEEIDKLAKKMGLSRSALVNMTMRAAILGETKNMGAFLVQSLLSNMSTAKEESSETAVAG